MKVSISYELHTDGDFHLNNLDLLGCYHHDPDNHLYVGQHSIECSDLTTCRMGAGDFLQQFLCDGVHVGYTHYYLLAHFYNMIEELLTFLKHNESGSHRVDLSGNYSGTYISIRIEDVCCEESLSEESNAKKNEESQEWVIIDKVNEFGYCPSKYAGMFNMTMMRHAHVFNNKSDADQIAERLNETHQYHLEVLPKAEMLVYVIYNNVKKAKNRANALNDLPLVNELSSVLDAMNKLGYIDTTECLVREE